ncbi:CTLH/CRA C-terminal to lish motif domain-containing protein [Xylariaceae sp. FL0804]|nr:CTLH/CRA C-terminal to lish motif domain-containing protein [Xylariaceae sp. FL0804]
MALLQLQKDLEKLTSSARLADALDDVDNVLKLLTDARDQVAASSDPHTTSLTLTKLQNPIKQELEGVTNNLKRVHKSHNDFSKSLKTAFAHTEKGGLPTEHDPMESRTPLINRAIAMHLLREGQFAVASKFIGEAQPQSSSTSDESPSDPQPQPSSSILNPAPSSFPETDDAMITDTDIPADLTAFQSRALQAQFAGMYEILSALKGRDLSRAIQWARANSAELEARGSNLEFELCKLQFVWLFKGPAVNGLPDTADNGVSGALKYARENFGRFQHRHIREIQKLSCAMVYARNLAASPYRAIFDVSPAFDDVAANFTREFCSLLGLSAESPLFVAATAGALALPQLVKYTSRALTRGTEWTTQNELAFETPLPRSMVYHSIFVCPVSKEQTTDANPPVILPCGHVLARESLMNMAKGVRYKCPYCPSEGVTKDAREIIF